MKDADEYGDRLEAAAREIERTLNRVIVQSIDEIMERHRLEPAGAVFAAQKACVCAGLLMFSDGKDASGDSERRERLRDQVEDIVLSALEECRKKVFDPNL